MGPPEHISNSIVKYFYAMYTIYFDGKYGNLAFYVVLRQVFVLFLMEISFVGFAGFAGFVGFAGFAGFVGWFHNNFIAVVGPRRGPTLTSLFIIS